MIRHTAPPSIRLAIENGKLPSSVKEKLAKVVQAHKKVLTDSDVLYGQLVQAAEKGGGDGYSIAGAKRNIVSAVKSSKEWVQLFEMYMQFETDENLSSLSESKIIGEMNESGRSLETLFEACENAKGLTRLADAKGLTRLAEQENMFNGSIWA